MNDEEEKPENEKIHKAYKCHLLQNNYLMDRLLLLGASEQTVLQYTKHPIAPLMT